jgi:ATP-dependent DNA helicase RecG
MRPFLLDPLFAPLTALGGIGPKMAPLFDRLLTDGKRSSRILDLLLHLPYAAIDRRRRARLSDAEPGVLTTFELLVLSHRPSPPGRRGAPYRVLCEDETGEVSLVFFNAGRARMEALLPVGGIRFVSGSIEIYDGRRQIVHPDRMMDAAAFDRSPLVEPVYGRTEGLSRNMVHKAATAALARLPSLAEWIDPALVAREGWPSFEKALEALHRPETPDAIGSASPARLRLAYDELLAGQAALLLVRKRMKRESGVSRLGDGRMRKAVLQSLPFALTASQTRAVEEIAADLAKPERMLRLLQGDVGSGKTLVAVLAMTTVVEAGFQAALMAPTEILARQHFERLSPIIGSAGLRLALLTGREKGHARASVREGLAEGTIDMVVGTHALFQEDVAFARLGLAVIDEQHRFGVHQRLALSRKGTAVDVLVMTATPIPRTLVLTYFGDMDVSVLREKPAGRMPIDTRVIPLDRLGEVEDAIGRALSAGRRVYWICPLVGESEDLDVAAAEERFDALRSRFGTVVGLVHGRMKGLERDAVMDRFGSGEISILVATTVVEVGVDVPEASVMVIEHAERFGLAQLHQLRGRVGRGSEKSDCLLLYKPGSGETARARLEMMRSTEDGFVIAEEDLRLRGEGDVLGTRQSGMPGFRLAVPERHADLLAVARKDAESLMVHDGSLETARGHAVRLLLHIFERDEAVRLLQAG